MSLTAGKTRYYTLELIGRSPDRRPAGSAAAAAAAAARRRPAGRRPSLSVRLFEKMKRNSISFYCRRKGQRSSWDAGCAKKIHSNISFLAILCIQGYSIGSYGDPFDLLTRSTLLRYDIQEFLFALILQRYGVNRRFV